MIWGLNIAFSLTYYCFFLLLGIINILFQLITESLNMHFIVLYSALNLSVALNKFLDLILICLHHHVSDPYLIICDAPYLSLPPPTGQFPQLIRETVHEHMIDT